VAKAGPTSPAAILRNFYRHAGRSLGACHPTKPPARCDRNFATAMASGR
jgi:hypothetical protein